MLRSVHGDVARPGGGRAVIERYRNARPARVIRPVLHGRTVQRNGRGLRPAAEREDIPRRAGDRRRLRIPLRDRVIRSYFPCALQESRLYIPQPLPEIPVQVPSMTSAKNILHSLIRTGTAYRSILRGKERHTKCALPTLLAEHRSREIRSSRR